MALDGKDGQADLAARIVQLRDYTRTMSDRIAALRGRARNDTVGEVLDEALQELEVTREELAVADEEISTSEARFETALRALEADVRHYRELFDGAPDGYALTDPLGVIREGNGTLSIMLGVHKRFLEGKPLVNFVARGDVRKYRDALGAVLRGQGEGELLSLRLRPRHGEPVFVAEIMRQLVRGVGDRVTAIRWTVRKAPPRKASDAVPPTMPPEPADEESDAAEG